MELNEMKNLPQRKINNNKINGKIFTLYASRVYCYLEYHKYINE